MSSKKHVFARSEAEGRVTKQSPCKEIASPLASLGVRKDENKKLHRVIDVNLNRSREALRVCEDITRFALNDKALTKSLKNIRHSVSKISVGAYCNTPLQSRNIRTDIGKKSSFDKSKPKNIKSLFYNNIHRAEESIRALEEFSKISAPGLSKNFKVFRFKIYSLEKKILKKL